MAEMESLASEHLLRTLAPALRRLEGDLQSWLGTIPASAMPMLARATLDGLAADLKRSAEALDVDRPLLVIVLVGGTGVGKSTLLNALAGGAVAEASFVRPTTRDPVVYYHDSLKPERLEPVLRQCRLTVHYRAGMEQKIIIDTPDLDSNDLSHRETLKRILPAADIVLYVGSQEKYHDRLGWDMFIEQRRRHAFAFVLNKWDRCLSGTGGTRPDEDLRRDLEEHGFKDPLLFRTCAQLWVERGASNGELPPGEQFAELASWIENGLKRLEIEAIKARGVSQILHQLQVALASARPPDLSATAGQVGVAWDKILTEEAGETVDVLLNTVSPYQREIEHHFALQGQGRFRGPMAAYLNTLSRLRYAGGALRDRLSVLPKSALRVESPADWDLAAFTRDCSRVASDLHLDARSRALPNRLLLAADGLGFPLKLLVDPTEAAAKSDWRKRHALSLVEILQQVECEWAAPDGPRRWIQAVIVRLADWLPALALLAASCRLLWLYFASDAKPELGDALLLLLVPVVVMVVLHLLMILLLPVRWPAIREEFKSKLQERVRGELSSVYEPIPDQVVQALELERRRLEKLSGETAEVAAWLRQREKAASIEGLYGD